jgi:urease accessory protein
MLGERGSGLMLGIIAAPLGNLATFAVGDRRVERVLVRSDDSAKRLLRLATSAGEIGLRFAGAERLRDGDVVHADAERVVAVAVEPDDVLVGRPPTIAAALALAHALGNRHLPVQIEGETIVVRFDPLLPALFAEHGVPCERAARVVAEPFRHAHAPHGHD